MTTMHETFDRRKSCNECKWQKHITFGVEHWCEKEFCKTHLTKQNDTEYNERVEQRMLDDKG